MNDLIFNTSFRNPEGRELAGTWFDTERGKWRVSTVPVRGFETEREAAAFYDSNCDLLTGMLSMRHRERLKSRALAHGGEPAFRQASLFPAKKVR